MALLYSTKLFTAAASAGSGALVVPDGMVAVLRDLDAAVPLISSPVVVHLVGDAGQVITVLSFTVTGEPSLSWRGRQVIPAGLTYQLVVTGGVADLSLSGYLLTAP